MIDLINAQLWYDSLRGVHIPQCFAREIDINYVPLEFRDDIQTLLNPDNEMYQDAWENILDNFRLPINGKEAFFYQDGDVWLVPTDNDYDGWAEQQTWLRSPIC